MADYYRDVIRLLREAGYEFKRQDAATMKFGGTRELAFASLLIES
jgi:hypothetical protein